MSGIGLIEGGWGVGLEEIGVGFGVYFFFVWGGF